MVSYIHIFFCVFFVFKIADVFVKNSPVYSFSTNITVKNNFQSYIHIDGLKNKYFFRNKIKESSSQKPF